MLTSLYFKGRIRKKCSRELCSDWKTHIISDNRKCQGENPAKLSHIPIHMSSSGSVIFDKSKFPKKLSPNSN